MNKFTDLELSPLLHRNLARNSYVTPTPVQALSIPPAMTGADVVATAQTGTGKTLAFLLPILMKLDAGKEAVKETAPVEAADHNTAQQHPEGSRKGAHHPKQGGAVAHAYKEKQTPRALVLAPTRELALQIADSFSKMSAGSDLHFAVVVGGMSEQTQLNAIRRGVSIVIATPGRLEDFMTRRLVDLSKVTISVLDEADRMLDMGFAPAIEKILSVLPKNRQSLFFSATMDKTVERLIHKFSKEPVAHYSTEVALEDARSSRSWCLRSGSRSQGRTSSPHAYLGGRLLSRIHAHEARCRPSNEASIGHRH